MWGVSFAAEEFWAGVRAMSGAGAGTGEEDALEEGTVAGVPATIHQEAQPVVLQKHYQP